MSIPICMIPKARRLSGLTGACPNETGHKDGRWFPSSSPALPGAASHCRAQCPPHGKTRCPPPIVFSRVPSGGATGGSRARCHVDWTAREIAPCGRAAVWPHRYGTYWSSGTTLRGQQGEPQDRAGDMGKQHLKSGGVSSPTSSLCRMDTPAVRYEVNHFEH